MTYTLNATRDNNIFETTFSIKVSPLSHIASVSFIPYIQYSEQLTNTTVLKISTFLYTMDSYLDYLLSDDNEFNSLLNNDFVRLKSLWNDFV